MDDTAKDYYFIDKFIIGTLKNSSQPLSDLAINFMINQAAEKIIPFKAVKTRLRVLEDEGRVLRKIENNGGKDIYCFYLK